MFWGLIFLFLTTECLSLRCIYYPQHATFLLRLALQQATHCNGSRCPPQTEHKGIKGDAIGQLTLLHLLQVTHSALWNFYVVCLNSVFFWVFCIFFKI